MALPAEQQKVREAAQLQKEGKVCFVKSVELKYRMVRCSAANAVHRSRRKR